MGGTLLAWYGRVSQPKPPVAGSILTAVWAEARLASANEAQDSERTLRIVLAATDKNIMYLYNERSVFAVRRKCAITEQGCNSLVNVSLSVVTDYLHPLICLHQLR
jgi:hypothetical protein